MLPHSVLFPELRSVLQQLAWLEGSRNLSERRGMFILLLSRNLASEDRGSAAAQKY